jgi:hypothetical protein
MAFDVLVTIDMYSVFYRSMFAGLPWSVSATSSKPLLTVGSRHRLCIPVAVYTALRGNYRSEQRYM